MKLSLSLFHSKFWWFVALYCLFSSVYAQETFNIIPPSPTAAALGKYGDIPVNTYTGIPSIDIPLYEIRSRDISVPITMSYHAGGVRVEEEASWVGLGWSLNAGGVITRSVRGKDDLGPLGYAASGLKVPDLPSQTGPPVPDYPWPVTPFAKLEIDKDCIHSADDQQVNYSNLMGQGVDFEPDVFYYNFMGISGKFILENDSDIKAVLIKEDKMSITYENKTWKVIDANGFVYRFAALENTQVENEVHTTAWYLTEIISTTGEQVVFEYSEPISLFPISTVSEVIYERGEIITPCEPAIKNPRDEQRVQPKITQIHLRKISFSNGYIKFNIDEDERLDLLQGQRLESIAVYRKSETTFSLLKSFAFSHSYFVGKYSKHYSTDGELTSIERVRDRLRLDAIQELGESAAKPPYQFDYHYDDNDPKLQLPYKSSYSRDHWGFYNNANNSQLIPTYVASFPTLPYDLPGANRGPNASTMPIGTIKSITYPTGGTTTFNFEANTYATNQRIGDLVFKPINVSTGNTDADLNLGEIVSEPFVHEGTFMTGKINLVYFGECEGQGWYRNGMYFYLRNVESGQIEQTWFTDGLTLVNQDGGTACSFTLDGPEGRNFKARAGTYRLEVDMYPTMTMRFNATFEVIYQTRQEPKTVATAGGLRIAQIRHSEGESPDKIESFSYEENGNSSGVLMAKPVYEFFSTNSNGIYYACDMLVRSSSTNVPLSSSAQGSSVGYSKVTTKMLGSIGTGNGMTEFYYENQADIYNNLSNNIASFPTVQYHRNGLLQEQKDYDKYGKILRKVTNTYNFELPGYDKATLHPAAKVEEYIERDETPENSLGCARYNLYFYPLFSEWIQLQETQEILYNQGAASKQVATTITFQYEEDPIHYQIKEQSATDSEGRQRVTSYTYPADANSGAPAVMWNENDPNYRHMHRQVVEQVVKVDNNATTRVNTTYLNENGLIVPTLITTYPTGGEEAVSTNLKYDAKGNVVQVLGTNGIPTTYLWGYNQTLPVAKIVGAGLSEVEQLLEPTFHAGEGSLSDGQITMLRDNLGSAQVTAYRYKPLVGITTIIDPNNHRTTYEYDALNRLRVVKDQTGNILQHYQYHYAKQ